MPKKIHRDLYFLIIALIISLFVYVYILGLMPVERVQITRLTQSYALLALTCLYLALLVVPLSRTFLSFPGRTQYLKSANSLVLVAFYFGIIHGYFSFFKQLGGFEDLGFLSEKYIIAITLSLCALILIGIAVLCSSRFISTLLPRYLKRGLTLILYIAGMLITIHALMLGTHFQNLFGFIPQMFFSFITILLILQAYQIDQWFQDRIAAYPKFGISVILMTSLLSCVLFLYTFSSDALPSLGIHTQHIQLAKEQLSNSQTQSTIPGLDGDKTKRYTVSMNAISNIVANQSVPLTFTINQAESGNPVYYFKTPYEKPMHLIIVDEELAYFEHIHPSQQDNTFRISTQFPHDGIYHLYVNFQPFGGIEQEDAFVIKVGTGTGSQKTNEELSALTKQAGDYTVKLAKNTYNASQMTIGQEKMIFTVTNTKTHQPVTTLKPYLNAFGHLVMINTQTYDYLHVHPTNLKAPSPNSNGGPEVSFLPIGIYGPFKPGIYKVFAQFNPDGKLFTMDFTIKLL